MELMDYLFIYQCYEKKKQLFYELKTAFYETIKKYFHFLFSQNILLSSCKNIVLIVSLLREAFCYFSI